MKYLKLTNTLFLSIFYPLLTVNLYSKNTNDKPNIIIILADDLGWGDVEYNGHPVIKTPNLNKMTEAGVRFDRFYAAAPVSSPTRASILTGRHPNRSGVFSWGHTLRPQEITIAEKLKEAGYVTGQFGKWHLGSVYKDSPVNPGNSGFDEWFSSPNFFENDPILSREGVAVQTKGESSIVTIEAALEFVRKHKNSQPFFAYVCLGSPHQPHIAKEQDKMPYLFLEERFQNFYGEITGMDRAIGILRSQLEEMGLHENTILWFLSDNGGLSDLSRDPVRKERRYLSSTGGREYKGSIYEGGLRVPAILEWPRQFKKSKIIDAPVNSSDIYPTLLEITGIESSNRVLDGINLFHMLKGKVTLRKKPMGFWQYPEKGKGTSSGEIMSSLLKQQRKGDMKIDSTKLLLNAGDIIKQYTDDDLIGHSAWLDWPYKLHRITSEDNKVIFELYNLDRDPWEENDISLDNPDRLKIMSSELRTWMESIINSLNGNDY